MPRLAQAILAALWAAAPLPAPPAAETGEYSVKAAFLFNFAKFVDWPAEADTAGRPLVIVVFGKDPFGRSFLRFWGPPSRAAVPTVDSEAVLLASRGWFARECS
jgi:hypothetical protein